MIGRVVFAVIDAAFTVAMAADETVDRAKRYARVLRRRWWPAAQTETWSPRATLRPPPPER